MVKTKIKNPKVEGDDFPAYEPEDQEMGRREVTIGDHSFTVIQMDRYALWEIRKVNEGGPLPKELQGSFTSIHQAELAIKVYLGNLAATN